MFRSHVRAFGVFALFALALLPALSAKATLIGTDIDILLTVDGNEVINQTLSVTAPYSDVYNYYDDIVFYVSAPDGRPVADETSFAFAPIDPFHELIFYPGEVVLTVSNLMLDGPVTGVGFHGYAPPTYITFTDTSVTAGFEGLYVGLPTYHFDIELPEAAVDAPGAAVLLVLAAAGLAFRRRAQSRKDATTGA